MLPLLEHEQRNRFFLIPFVVLAISYQVAYAATVIWGNLHATQMPALFIQQDAAGRVSFRTPAVAKAGIEIGDTIAAVGGKPNRSQMTLLDALKKKKVGDQIHLTVRKKALAIDRSVTASVEPDSPAFPSPGDWLITLMINTVLLLSVSLGSYVVLRLPTNPRAFFLFAMLASLGSMSLQFVTVLAAVAICTRSRLLFVDDGDVPHCNDAFRDLLP